MNQKILIIVLVALVSSCNSKKSEIQKLWINTTRIEKKDLDSNYLKVIRESKDTAFVNYLKSRYNHSMRMNNIYHFTGDSLTRTVFNESFYGGYRTMRYRYRFSGDSIKIYLNDGGTFSIYIDKVSRSELIMKSRLKNKENVILLSEPLKTFKKKGKSTELERFLVSNLFKNNLDATILEFSNHFGRILIHEFEKGYDWGEKNVWAITTIQDELFLVLGGTLVHIKDVSSKEIKGIIYEDSVKDIEFSLSKVTIDIEKKPSENIIGTWFAIDPNSTFRKLVINDTIAFTEFGGEKDWVRWALNRSGDKVVFSRAPTNEESNYWEILNLTERSLRIRRIIKSDNQRVLDTLELIKYENKGSDTPQERGKKKYKSQIKKR